ncbi:Alpha/Beta hydrolase protein [Syncephalis fuscata]|nr:Alpha/Beta hydrolase protein [Syncephalis fuscata]
MTISQPTASTQTFDKLSGDIIVIHGFAGSKLVDTRQNNKEYWITQELLDDKIHPPMHLPITTRDNEPDPIITDGYLTNKTYIEYYSSFINGIEDAARVSNGRFRVHLFDYDFRRNNIDTIAKFIHYVEDIYRRRERRAVTVIAHSMGGIITLNAVHKRPELFKAAIFAGSPFNGSITALQAKLNGTPVGRNTECFTAETHFQLQSSFSFFPFDSTGLVKPDGSDWHINYYDANEWLRYKLSPVLSTTNQLAMGSYKERVDYLHYAIERARQSRDGVIKKPNHSNFVYPKFVIIAGNTLPTPYRYQAKETTDGLLDIDYAQAIQVKGDGLIALSSAQLPQGIPYKTVYSTHGHMTLLDDLTAVRQAINLIVDN